jgi:hypothetical protein
MSTAKRIRRLVREEKVELSDHALEEMDNDQLTLEQVRTVLLHCALQDKKDVESLCVI